MVKVYSRKSCSPCHTLRYLLDKRGIQYDLQDIDEHPDPSITMVPTVEINGERIVGFNLSRLLLLIGADS